LRIKIGLVWFRHDLRLYDNLALTEATNQCDVVLPVFVFDERMFEEKSEYGFRKIGVQRAKFLIESVINLKKSFAERNIELIVRFGKTEEVIYSIASQIRSTWVYCNRERTPDEEKIQDNLENKLWQVGQELRYSRGKMLYHTGDLPFPIRHTPDTYAAFYREVGKIVPVRKPLPIPDKILPYMGNVPSESIPTLEELGYSEEEINGHVSEFKGGEFTALKMLDDFIKNHFKVKALGLKKKKGQKVLVTHLSPYLNSGCISPKTIYNAINKFMGNKYHKNRANCIIHGLMRRDYLKLLEKKYKEKVFEYKGIKGVAPEGLSDDMNKFGIWKDAITGVPIVDAFMRELNTTGFISFEGRRILSQFLIEELKVNWRIGAEYFQSVLIDYNACSNWGNWNIVAGVGYDAKEDRYCNFITKSKKLDPKGEFIRRWIPELSPVKDSFIHEPDKMTNEQLQEIHLDLGEDYPNPVVDTDRWV